jgi:hypothetical protein
MQIHQEVIGNNRQILKRMPGFWQPLTNLYKSISNSEDTEFIVCFVSVLPIPLCS